MYLPIFGKENCVKKLRDCRAGGGDIIMDFLIANPTDLELYGNASVTKCCLNVCKQISHYLAKLDN